VVEVEHGTCTVSLWTKEAGSQSGHSIIEQSGCLDDCALQVNISQIIRTCMYIIPLYIWCKMRRVSGCRAGISYGRQAREVMRAGEGGVYGVPLRGLGP
jgi:hypothetical protein